MTTVTIEEAQRRLPQLIAEAVPGEGILITRGTQPVAQLVPIPVTTRLPIPGSCKGKLVVVEEDDAHLADFSEYMK